MSGFGEIKASVSPAREILPGGSDQLLVRVHLDSCEGATEAFIDLRATCARRLALEILAAADDADWQTEQDRLPGAGTMSAPIRATATRLAPRPRPTVPSDARALAARLAALFEQDSEIVKRLNDAHHRLAGAYDRLRSGLAPDRFVIHHQIHQAFCAYQQASEQRRRLAVDVGELSQQLTDALTAAGYRPQHARSANVHELAAGTWQPTEGKENQR